MIELEPEPIDTPEETNDLMDLLMGVAQPIIEAREQQRAENARKIASLHIEYERVLALTKQRIAAEEAICRDVSEQILLMLKEIKRFATKHSIYPPYIADDGRPPRYTSALIGLHEGACKADLPVKAQQLTSESSLNKEIQRLLDVHVIRNLRLWWEFHVEEGYQVSVILRFPDEVHVNGRVFHLHDVSSDEFKNSLVEAFYSVEDRYHGLRYALKDGESTSWRDAIAEGPKNIRKLWNLIWADLRVNADDPFLVRIWYGKPTSDPGQVKGAQRKRRGIQSMENNRD